MKLSALILVLVMVVSVFGNTAMAAGWGSTSWNPWGWFFGGQEKKETEAATEAAELAPAA